LNEHLSSLLGCDVTEWVQQASQEREVLLGLRCGQEDLESGVVRLKPLTPTARLLLLELRALANYWPVVRTYRAELAGLVGCSDTGVGDALVQLRAAGAIRVRSDRGRGLLVDLSPFFAKVRERILALQAEPAPAHGLTAVPSPAVAPCAPSPTRASGVEPDPGDQVAEIRRPLENSPELQEVQSSDNGGSTQPQARESSSTDDLVETRDRAHELHELQASRSGVEEHPPCEELREPSTSSESAAGERPADAGRSGCSYGPSTDGPLPPANGRIPEGSEKPSSSGCQPDESSVNQELGTRNRELRPQAGGTRNQEPAQGASRPEPPCELRSLPGSTAASGSESQIRPLLSASDTKTAGTDRLNARQAGDLQPAGVAPRPGSATPPENLEPGTGNLEPQPEPAGRQEAPQSWLDRMEDPPRGEPSSTVRRRLEAVGREYYGALPLHRLADRLMRLSRWRTELYPFGCPWDWIALADGLELLVCRRVLNPLAYATKRVEGRVNMVERLGHEADERRRRPAPSGVVSGNVEHGTRNQEHPPKAGDQEPGTRNLELPPEDRPATCEEFKSMFAEFRQRIAVRSPAASTRNLEPGTWNSRRNRAEARAAGLLEFDARCPEASAEARARFVEELEELVRKGGGAPAAVEVAMKLASKSRNH